MQTVERIRGRRLQQLRAAYLRRHPLCKRCEAQGRVTAAVELDHIDALVNGGGNEWTNYQGLCAACHADKTREDLGQRVPTACGVDGVPLDPRHHWNA